MADILFDRRKIDTNLAYVLNNLVDVFFQTGNAFLHGIECAIPAAPFQGRLISLLVHNARPSLEIKPHYAVIGWAIFILHCYHPAQ